MDGLLVIFGSAGVFCPYFFVQFSPGLRDARGDIEFLLLSMAIPLSLMLLLPRNALS
jgi:hypothetical protein